MKLIHSFIELHKKSYKTLYVNLKICICLTKLHFHSVVPSVVHSEHDYHLGVGLDSAYSCTAGGECGRGHHYANLLCRYATFMALDIVANTLCFNTIDVVVLCERSIVTQNAIRLRYHITVNQHITGAVQAQSTVV